MNHSAARYSADTVVRAMNVKYRKWRLEGGGSCNFETP